MPFCTTSDGVRIHYRDVAPALPSSALPVLLVHGLGMSQRFWFDLPERIAADPQRPRRVLAVDNRGVGESDTPGGAYTMARLAKDASEVLAAAGVERAVVVGASLGGMISQHLTLDFPERVGALVLVATTPGLPLGRLPRWDALFTLLSAPFRRRFDRHFYRLLLSERDVPRGDELFVRWRAAFAESPVRTQTFFSQLAAALRHSTGWRLHQIACPTYVITGDDDILIRPDNSRRIAARIPGAELIVLPHIGHAVPMVDRDIIPATLARIPR